DEADGGSVGHAQKRQNDETETSNNQRYQYQAAQIRAQTDLDFLDNDPNPLAPAERHELRQIADAPVAGGNPVNAHHQNQHKVTDELARIGNQCRRGAAKLADNPRHFLTDCVRLHADVNIVAGDLLQKALDIALREDEAIGEAIFV